jgi:hypothetical protein
MALETSGTLSIGGTTTNRSINLELGRSATATSSLGETDLRDLAGVASGAIAIDDFYGASSGPYEIDNSLKLEPDNSEFLTQTIGTGNRRTATYSFWLKRTELDASSYMQVAGISPISSETVRFMFYQDHIMLENGVGGTQKRLTTNAVYRDTSAFYHFVVAIDTTQSTAANRVKLYVNGVQETSFSTEQYPDQNFDLTIGVSGNTWRYGAYDSTYYKIAGYLAEAHYIDGTQYAASDFGEFDEDSGIWKPKEFTGTYGTQGHYLDFKDSADLGANAKGSDVNFTLNNITASDQATDTPTNNFCTMNQNSRTNGNIRTQEGGTYVTTDGGSGWCSMVATMAVGSGKWYWEALYYNNGDADDVHIGVVPANDKYIPSRQGGYYMGNVETGGSMGWDLDGGTNYNQNGSWGNPSRGDKLMVALDMDNYKLYYGRNGTWGNSANPANGTGSVTAISTYWMVGLPGALDFVMPGVSVYQGNYMKGFNFGGYCAWTIASAASDANGYGTFEYAPPTGFYALCSKNLAEYG